MPEQALIRLRDGTLAKVDVFRNGDTVFVQGIGKQETPAGPIEGVIQLRMGVPAFEWAREQAIRTVGPLVYSRVVGALGISSQMQAPPQMQGPLPSVPMLPSGAVGRR